MTTGMRSAAPTSCTRMGSGVTLSVAPVSSTQTMGALRSVDPAFFEHGLPRSGDGPPPVPGPVEELAAHMHTNSNAPRSMSFRDMDPSFSLSFFGILRLSGRMVMHEAPP